MNGRAWSETMEARVMDCLMDYPQTPADLAARLEYTVEHVRRCLRSLQARSLVRCMSNIPVTSHHHKAALYEMARTRKQA